MSFAPGGKRQFIRIIIIITIIIIIMIIIIMIIIIIKIQDHSLAIIL